MIKYSFAYKDTCVTMEVLHHVAQRGTNNKDTLLDAYRAAFQVLLPQN